MIDRARQVGGESLHSRYLLYVEGKRRKDVEMRAVVRVLLHRLATEGDLAKQLVALRSNDRVDVDLAQKLSFASHIVTEKGGFESFGLAMFLGGNRIGALRGRLESVQNAARRELWEEAGVVIKQVKSLTFRSLLRVTKMVPHEVRFVHEAFVSAWCSPLELLHQNSSHDNISAYVQLSTNEMTTLLGRGKVTLEDGHLLPLQDSLLVWQDDRLRHGAYSPQRQVKKTLRTLLGDVITAEQKTRSSLLEVLLLYHPAGFVSEEEFVWLLEDKVESLGKKSSLAEYLEGLSSVEFNNFYSHFFSSNTITKLQLEVARSIAERREMIEQGNDNVQRHLLTVASVVPTSGQLRVFGSSGFFASGMPFVGKETSEKRMATTAVSRVVLEEFIGSVKDLFQIAQDRVGETYFHGSTDFFFDLNTYIAEQDRSFSGHKAKEINTAYAKVLMQRFFHHGRDNALETFHRSAIDADEWLEGMIDKADVHLKELQFGRTYTRPLNQVKRLNNPLQLVMLASGVIPAGVSIPAELSKRAVWEARRKLLLVFYISRVTEYNLATMDNLEEIFSAFEVDDSALPKKGEVFGEILETGTRELEHTLLIGSKLAKVYIEAGMKTIESSLRKLFLRPGDFIRQSSDVFPPLGDFQATKNAFDSIMTDRWRREIVFMPHPEGYTELELCRREPIPTELYSCMKSPPKLGDPMCEDHRVVIEYIQALRKIPNIVIHDYKPVPVGHVAAKIGDSIGSNLGKGKIRFCNFVLKDSVTGVQEEVQIFVPTAEMDPTTGNFIYTPATDWKRWKKDDDVPYALRQFHAPDLELEMRSVMALLFPPDIYWHLPPASSDLRQREGMK
ncbi:MAG: NUDIX hydrolase [bacterium]